MLLGLAQRQLQTLLIGDVANDAVHLIPVTPIGHTPTETHTQPALRSQLVFAGNLHPQLGRQTLGILDPLSDFLCPLALAIAAQHVDHTLRQQGIPDRRPTCGFLPD